MRDVRLLPIYVAKAWDEVEWKLVTGGLASVANFFIGDLVAQKLAVGLGALIALDTVTGVTVAARTGKQVSSAKLSRTGVKLLGYFSVIIAGSLVLRLVPFFEAYHGEAIAALLGFFLLTEALSVIENTSKLGVKFPKALRRLLHEAHEHLDDDDPPKR